MIDNRILREQKTLESMIGIFCSQNHKQGRKLCAECKALLDYSVLRLNRCTFGTRKPICSKCQLHCYKQDARERVRQIMRYSGSRMLFMHPVQTIRHFMDSIE